MHFGESLVRLKTDILAEYNERSAAADARRTSLSSLRDDVRQVLVRNAAQRVELAKLQSASARELRSKLADENAQLNLDVEQKRKENVQSFAETRKKLSADADALRASLVAFRCQSVSDVAAFRTEVRAHQAETAVAVAADLKTFVAAVKAQSDEVRQAVQEQLSLARGAWGQPESAAVAQAKASPKVASAEKVSADKKTESATIVEAVSTSASETSPSASIKDTASNFARGRKREHYKSTSSEDEGGAGSLYSAGQTE